MPNEPLLATAADLWHTWNQRRIKAAGDDNYFQEDYDLIAAVTAIYRKQVELLVAQHVKDQLEVDAASKRLADEIAELLGTK
jgi:hypothetical protein